MDKLSQEEKIKLKTLCEFAFCGLQSYTTTYERFEKCFQPLFNDNIKINLYEAYISMIGEKKKYLTYPRFVNAYLKYKEIKEKKLENKNDLYIFFSNIFEKILKGINDFVGEHENSSKNSDIICLSTKRGILHNEEIYKRSFISTFQVLVDSEDRIIGVIIEYDNMNQYKLYPEENNGEKQITGLKVKLNILDENFFKLDNKKAILNEHIINKALYHDSVTHIFGTIKKDTHAINFLGFKCFSGKIAYIGKPKGESFLFGEFGKRFYNLRLEINPEKGITFFDPGFISNESINYFKQKFKYDISNISLIDLNKNIYEESNLKNLDKDLLNYIITTNFEDDKNLFEEEEGEIKIYNYKEVITLSNRSWIKNEEKKIEEKNDLILENPLVIKNINSQGKPTNYMNINLENEKELYSYNPNPFLKGIDPPYLQLKNPFFNKNNDKSNKTNVKLHFHRLLKQSQQKEKEKEKESNNKNNEIVKNSILIDILKEKSFKNILADLSNILKKKSFKNIMADLSNDIHNESIKEIFHKDNNNINFSLIPFYILNEIIPKEANERKKKKTFKKVENKKILTLNGEQIKSNDQTVFCKHSRTRSIPKINMLPNFFAQALQVSAWPKLNKTSSSTEHRIKMKNKNNVKSDQSDAAYYWGKIKTELPIKKKIKDGDIEQKWKNLEYVALKLSEIRKIMVELSGGEKIKLSDKIKYYKILSDKENENIINLITQRIKDENNSKNLKLKDIDVKLDVGPLKSLKDIEGIIKNLSKQIKDSSQEHKLEQIKYYKNIYIESLEKRKLDENKKIQDIKKEYESYRASETEKNKKVSAYLDDEANYEEKEDYRAFGGLERNRDPGRVEENENPTYLGYGANDKLDEQNKEIKIYLQQEIFNVNENDPKFKPKENSLCPYEEKKNDWFRPLPFGVLSDDIENWKNIGWKKSKGIDIFSSNPTLDNIRQGDYIGDCYFLAALGALCDRKEYLKNLIKKIKSENGETIGYKVKLNLNGEWKYVLVDKNFPCLKGNHMFCFGSSFQDELWVSIFEKAWAKVNGCYARICGGKCGEGFNVLTSAITEYYLIVEYDDKKIDELWNKLKDAKDEKNNYLIGAATKRLSLWDRFWGIGLVSSHAYTLINVYEKKYNNELIRLVKLRNPWGEKVFNKEWSKREDVLEPMYDEKKDDGIFYMLYEDFIKYFKSVEILKIRENYEIIASCKISKKEAYKMQIIELKILEIDNVEKIKVFINLYQKNPRIRKKNGDHYPEPAKAFLILAKKDSYGNYIFIKSKTDIKAHIGIEADLDTNSTYIIFCDVNYRFIYDELYGYNITFYCDKSYQDKKEPKNNKIVPKNITNEYNGKQSSEMLTKVLQNYFKDEKNKKNFEKIEINSGLFWGKTKFCVYRLKHFNEEFPFVILYIEDKEKDNNKRNYFRLDLNFKNLKYKEACIYNDSEASEFDISVSKIINDNNNIILIMGYTLTDIYSYNYNYEEEKSMSFIFEQVKPEIKKSFKRYIESAEKNKGFIIGLENSEKNKDLNIKLEIDGLIIINPEYNNINNNNIIKFIIKLEKGEKKVFNLRLKSNSIQPKFNTYT